MRIYLAIGCLLILCSCSGHKTNFSNEAEMNAYINDPANGYISSSETGDFKVETKLIPPVAGDKSPQLTVHLRLNRLDGLPVLEYGGVSQEEILEREGYLSFEAMGDAYIENGEAMEPAIFHHYERNYGLKPSVDLFFRFKKFNPVQDVVFVYRDQLFNQGMFRIKINKALLNSCHVQN